MKNLEIEYKWDGNLPQAFARMRRAAGPFTEAHQTKKIFLQDVYLDDEKRTLRSQKIALRLRCVNGIWEATLKTRSEVKNGKAMRKEYTLIVGKAKNFAQALLLFQAHKKWKNIELKPLRSQFEIRNQRQIYVLNFEGTQTELALDNFEIRVLGRRVKMKEIELELKKGCAQQEDALAALLSQQTQLPFAKISKVRTAEALLALWGKR